MELLQKGRALAVKVGAAVSLGLATVGVALASGTGPATTAATTAAASFTSDGTGAVTAIGGALLGLAGIAVVFKWAKAMFFG